RRRIQLPAVAIARFDFRAALQLLVVIVLDTQRAADLVDDVLIRGGVVAAGSFVADRGRGLPVGVNITSGECRPCRRVLVNLVREIGAAGAGRGRRTIEI